MWFRALFLLSVRTSAAILSLVQFRGERSESVVAVNAPAGYAMTTGRRAVHILATMRADASTMSVINSIKKALPEMQTALPPDIKVSFEFDQSPVSWRSA